MIIAQERRATENVRDGEAARARPCETARPRTRTTKNALVPWVAGDNDQVLVWFRGWRSPVLVIKFIVCSGFDPVLLYNTAIYWEAEENAMAEGGDNSVMA